jgi:hypothetical protein
MALALAGSTGLGVGVGGLGAVGGPDTTTATTSVSAGASLGVGAPPGNSVVQWARVAPLLLGGTGAPLFPGYTYAVASLPSAVWACPRDCNILRHRLPSRPVAASHHRRCCRQRTRCGPCGHQD